MLEHLRRQQGHLQWADARLLERLGSSPEPRALRLLAHVLGAERVWLSRLRGEDSGGLEVWPELDIDGCAKLAEQVHAELEGYLSGLDAARLEEPFTYRNQQGQPYSSRRSDVLIHLMLHGAYHRGQIAQTLRLAGLEPVNTDYITWVREERPPPR